MSDLPPLTRMVNWAQRLVGEVIGPGDLAVDLTAGTGRDTLHLFQRVGPLGRVLAFDIQEAALWQSAELLTATGARVDFWSSPPSAATIPPGVHLIRDSHARLSCYLGEAPRGVVANLGYLPGGDRTVVTAAESTLTALNHALVLLAPGGRMAVTLYVGHPGGRAEAEQVEALFLHLPPGSWDVLRLQVINRHDSPFLLVAGKRPDTSFPLQTAAA